MHACYIVATMHVATYFCYYAVVMFGCFAYIRNAYVMHITT